MSTAPRPIPVGAEPPPLEPPAPRPPAPDRRTAGPKPKRSPQTGRRFATINAFADFSLAELNRAELAVWLLLWRDTKPDGLARTSQADLARRAGITDRTVRRAIDGLEQRRLLLVVYRGGLRAGAATYRVCGLPALRAQADAGVRS